VTAFLVTASDCVFRGFDVVGVKVIVTGSNSQSECFRVAGGNRNRFEQLAMHGQIAHDGRHTHLQALQQRRIADA
jgi:hypothetical protein